MPVTIRRANMADLPAIVDIWYHSEVDEGGGDPLPYPRRPPGAFRHLLATADVRVAEEGGAAVGFVTLATRGVVSYLTLMYVRAERQSSGIGRALLESVIPPATGVYCTAASTDPRAQALYIRAGMQPAWPSFHLFGEVWRLRLPSQDGIEVVEAQSMDPELLRWDREISGQERPQDHLALGDTLPAVPLWFRRAGETIGYGYVHTSSDVVLGAPDAFAVGPVGARTPADAVACTLAAVGWVRERARLIRIALPGPHPALAPLLDAGFRIVYVEEFMSSASEPIFDPRLYCYAGAGLL